MYQIVWNVWRIYNNYEFTVFTHPRRNYNSTIIYKTQLNKLCLFPIVIYYIPE